MLSHETRRRIYITVKYSDIQCMENLCSAGCAGWKPQKMLGGELAVSEEVLLPTAALFLGTGAHRTSQL